jgi:hypothetical protein
MRKTVSSLSTPDRQKQRTGTHYRGRYEAKQVVVVVVAKMRKRKGKQVLAG